MKIKIFCKDPFCRPIRAHPTDAGLDLRAAQHIYLPPHHTELISTGVNIEMPPGYFGLVAQRSSFWNRDLSMPTSIGIIDAHYRGEIKVPLKNDKNTHDSIPAGERIAQIVFIPCITPELEFVTSIDDLETTDRGSNGFGSSGKK